jgi:alcohol dehydrogenase (NADP+)
MKYYSFSNGDNMPVIGLGTWKSAPGEVYNAVTWALEAGYRHIDCAAIYQNEKEVGNALHDAFDKGLVKREDIFVTSKLWNNAHNRDQVAKGLNQTLSDLQLEYLDLYLIHWPVSLKEEVMFPEKGEDFLTYEDVPLSVTWEGMEEIKEKGKAKHIGVSNFNQSKLKEIIKNASQNPEMNQIELHPYLPQEELVNFCKSNGIGVTAYSPLGSSDRPKARRREDDPVLLEDETIIKLAEKHQCSPAQVLIAYAIHRDLVVIPKSANKDRIKQNLDAASVKLSAEDMESIHQIEQHFRFIDGTFFTEVPGSPYKASDLWE